MNEHIQERFGRSRNAFKTPRDQAQVWIIPQQLNEKVRQYFDPPKKPVAGGHWLKRPEIPSSAEVLDKDTGGSTSSSEVELVPNRKKGAWESKEEYLGAHYELLREDAVRPLREAVSQVKHVFDAKEEAFNGAVGIYDKVRICGIICSTRGIAVRVTFSLFRAGKKILWEQSKRLITGSLVVLTPVDDKFQSKAIVATVAARPLEGGLLQNPPEIDLFIARAEEQELDPAIEYVMVEDRGGLYEADRHTLLALQRMMREPFPMNEHLVKVQANISAPEYVQQHSITNMTPALKNNRHETYENVDILKAWPKQPESDLDASQLDALRRILTKRLAIVQGPPGTGKTHISVRAVKIMLANRKPDDPPIIVACQTNHATDQILIEIAKFEPDFIRLGGRSKDKGIIKARTLYEVRKQTSENPLAGSVAPNARKKMKEMDKEFELLLSPVTPGKLPLDFRFLERLGLVSQRQADSLETGASEWVQDQLSDPNQARSPFTVWLGKALVTVPPKQMSEEYGFDYEEADFEFEQLKELEAENVAKDDEDFESLSGRYFPIADNFTCRRTNGIAEAKDIDDANEALKQQDMWKIPEALRPAVYRYLQAAAKKVILTAFREKAKRFNEWAVKRRIGFWEQDETILKKQKVVAMTTTGLSKYRGLLAALEPKVILIEEAGEILEAPVTVACLPSLQHLILVGDHKQLRPHCHVRAHEDKPFYLNVSLFERLVNNLVEFSTLSKQRRMIPEIRRLLYPIYKDHIKDQARVLNPIERPNVPGMGGVNSFFFTHQWAEQRDEHMSAFNPEEADMVVGLVEYLVYNGIEAEEITILTFYNGQRKRLLSELRKRISLVGKYFKVVTVDSYQGEENKVVILSLVRSNDKKQIGFLNIDNRVCVALSRAQCGFYLFGNGKLLHEESKTWRSVLTIMANQGPHKDRLKVEPLIRIAAELPVRCSNHDNVTQIKDADDWEKINGGCAVPCKGTLPCGHPCDIPCHPFPHDTIICRVLCGKSLNCGHKCQQQCSEVCACDACAKKKSPVKQITNVPHADTIDGKESPSKLSNSDSWKSFADDEPGRYAKAVAAATPFCRASPQKKDSAAASLLDLEPEDQMKQLSVGDSGSVSMQKTPALSNGKRGKWVENAGSKAATKHEKNWSKESSLLDSDL